MAGVLGTAASGGAAERLDRARRLLRRMEDRAQGVRPLPGAGPGDPVDRAGASGPVGAGSGAGPSGPGVGRGGPPDAVAAPAGVLPVAAPLAELLPAGGLRRGATVAVAPGPAATSVLFALLAEASAAGSWIGVVGRPGLGIAAAAEAGVRLERLALVPQVPARDLITVTAALVDGLDVVAVAWPGSAAPRPADRQRLAARARQRGAVLVPLGPWPGADVQLSCPRAWWRGPGWGSRGGAGRLRTREVQVLVHGRGIAPAGRSGRLLLPGEGGVERIVAGDAAAAVIAEAG